MKALNAGQALATVLVDELVRNGLAHACIAPGSRSTPLALAFAGHPGVGIHVLIDERSAAFCALGIARASGSPAAVLCTSGTAAANFHPAVIEADRGRIPLLVLTADRPPELRGTGANQTIDQIKLYGDAVRWFAEVGVPEALPASVAYWRSAACRAWAATVGSPPGPVHLNLAFRDPLVPVADDAGVPHPLDGRPGQEPWTRTGASPAGMSAEDRRGLRGLLAAADRCLVVAGEAPGGAGGARALAASGGWPLLADPLSGARMGPTAISAYEAILRHPGFAGAMRPDLVVRVGRMGTSKPLASYLGPEVPQVVVDPDGDWADPGRSARWIIRADPSELPSLVELSGPRGAPQGAGSAQTPWTQRWLEAEAAARPAIDAVLDADDSPSEPRTARDLAAWCPDGATLVAASSMPIRDLESFMRPRSGLRVIANRGASGIDGFVSTTLGAALAGRGRGRTVALAGDLSMLHDQNGLLLARSGSVDAVFVVVNNDGGGIFSFLPQAEFPGDFERLFGTPHGMPFEAVAALYRCGYRRVERAAGLTAAVGEALSAGGVHLVEVPTERTANVALHRRIWQAVGTALEAAGWGVQGGM
jgi:2-succinyl-5-enolpyruvyl-6-hydroxy-3-cyclohexene-1-carboxylate synthase